MPNWCGNELTIHANPADMEKIIDKIVRTDEEGREVLTFSKLVPLIRNNQIFPNGNCDVARELWGTKWEADTHDLTTTKNSLYASFDTAWSPPEQWVEALVEAFPDITLHLTFIEESMGFEGEMLYEKGNGLTQRCDDINFKECKKCHDSYPDFQLNNRLCSSCFP